MRTTYAFVGLVASVAAKTYVVTETQDVTVISCAPTVTNCPGNTWSDWSNTPTTKPVEPVKPSTWSQWNGAPTTKPVQPAQPSSWSAWNSASTKPVEPAKPSTWSDWSATTKPVQPAQPTTWANWQGSSYACPSYTASGPPDWYSQLPADQLSTLKAKWTAGAPSDWCYYTYSAVQTSTQAWSAVGTSKAVDAAATSSWGSWSATTAAPVAKYTGAASMNGASMAVAGLAAAAAIILA